MQNQAAVTADHRFLSFQALTGSVPDTTTLSTSNAPHVDGVATAKRFASHSVMDGVIVSVLDMPNQKVIRIFPRGVLHLFHCLEHTAAITIPQLLGHVHPPRYATQRNPRPNLPTGRQVRTRWAGSFATNARGLHHS